MEEFPKLPLYRHELYGGIPTGDARRIMDRLPSIQCEWKKFDGEIRPVYSNWRTIHGPEIYKPDTTIAPWAVCTTTTAQENQLELGFRPLVLVSQGEPANDMLGGGIVGTLHWKGDWYFGAALDFMKFDYERPQNLLGIAQPPNSKAVDGTDDFTRLSGWIERRYNNDRAWNWF